MTPEPHDGPPLPFRRLLLMPWRWPWWAWVVLALIWAISLGLYLGVDVLFFGLPRS